MINNEKTVWEGTSSQILNFWTYLTCLIIICGLIFAGFTFTPLAYFPIALVLFYMLWSHLVISSQYYRLTNERIVLQRGVFNKVTDELELYRVKDHRLEQPFFLRLFGLGHIILITSDNLNREVYVIAVKNSENLRESIRKLVEDRRQSRGVRELDTN